MKKVSKKSNSITVSDFKSWMAGVEDMQESGWVPNKTQWDRIKAKIALLSEDIVERNELVYESPNPVMQQQYAQPMPSLQYAPEQFAQPTYFEPQQFTAPQLNPNDSTISYMSGEKLDFL